jgi:D123.
MKKLIMTNKSDFFEDWYETVRDFTPDSVILPLTKDEETALRAISYDSFLKRGYYPDSMPLRPDNFAKEEENMIITNLKIRIDQVLNGEPKFFRANIFSPKDTGKCIVSSADDVIEAFILSERIFFKAPVLMEGKPMTFVFRNLIDIKEEYRVFVKEGTVIGVSQYEDSDVISRREPVQNIYSINEHDLLRVCDWVNDMLVVTGVDTAIVDIAKLVSDQYCIVELNPFNKVTDKCLLTKYDLYEKNYKHLIVGYATSINNIRFIELDRKGEEISIIQEESLQLEEMVRDISSMLSAFKLNGGFGKK